MLALPAMLPLLDKVGVALAEGEMDELSVGRALALAAINVRLTRQVA